MLPIRTILHPTDFTEHSNYAFQMACALARDYGAKLVVLHVYPVPVIPAGDGGLFPLPLEIPYEQLMAELNELKPLDPTLAVERTLIEGDPAFEILRATEKFDADLIVMGTHGRGGLSRLVMGSVAERVSRKAQCPVLTVRKPMGVIAAGPAKTVREAVVKTC